MILNDDPKSEFVRAELRRILAQSRTPEGDQKVHELIEELGEEDLLWSLVGDVRPEWFQRGALLFESSGLPLVARALGAQFAAWPYAAPLPPEWDRGLLTGDDAERRFEDWTRVEAQEWLWKSFESLNPELDDAIFVNAAQPFRKVKLAFSVWPIAEWGGGVPPLFAGARAPVLASVAAEVGVVGTYITVEPGWVILFFGRRDDSMPRQLEKSLRMEQIPAWRISVVE